MKNLPAHTTVVCAVPFGPQLLICFISSVGSVCSFRRRRRPLFVRPSRRPSRRRRPSSVCPSRRVPSSRSSSAVRPSVPSPAPSSSSVLCPSGHARPVVVVCPMSVRPVVRLLITCMTSRSILRMGIYVAIPIYVPFAFHSRSICVPFAFYLHSICVPLTFQKERKGNASRPFFLQEKVPRNAY